MNLLVVASILMLAYIFVGYPALMALAGMIRSRPVRREGERPSFSIVMIAYNEAGLIGRKLDNLAGVRAAGQANEVVVASDGSSDGTAEEARRWVALAMAEGEGGKRELAKKLRVREFSPRRGKPAVINDVVGACSGEVVVFMDVRQELDAGAIEALLEDMRDRRVRVVSGELVFRGVEGAVGEGISAYWAYEKALRKWESATGGVPGATGALYAVRRDLIPRLPEDVLLDDVYIPMKATERGGWCILEEKARIYDDPAGTVAQEETRKIRTLAGNLQLLRFNAKWILPGGHPLWVRFLSHKVLRLTTPVWLVGLLLGSAVEMDRPWCGALLVVQVAFYAAGIAGLIVAGRGKQPPGALAMPVVVISFVWAIVRAIYLYGRGRIPVTWEKAFDRVSG